MKRIDPRAAGALALVATLAACVAPPAGPTIPVVPGPGKSFAAFSTDQQGCMQYASAQTTQGAYAANNQAFGTALIGTALGAGLGAAVGGGHGAAIGAASGAALGTVAGAGGASYAQMSLQQQYDVVYAECMMAHGNRVPNFAPPPGAPPYGSPPPGAPPYGAPPPGYGPPPGYPPPPPYGQPY
jgi:hypothetical protein